MNRVARTLVLAAVGLALLSAPRSSPAQVTDRQSLGVGAHFQGYAFDDALGVDVANLLLIPVAYRLPVTETFSADLYAAYARGAVERPGGGGTFELAGPVDTRVRAVWRALPWAVVTASVNVPTGNESHDSEESLVASVLSTDLLGFRESTWGTGFGVTTGIATAHRVGSWGVGVGASYRTAGDFEPRTDTSFTYDPGNEARVRVALDRSFGEATKLTLGFTYQDFSTDQVDGRNLFQSGSRARVDGAFAFRTGAATWNAYAASIWRESGDVTLDILDAAGTVVGDTTFSTGSQTLAVVGITGAVPVSGDFRIRPTVDFRVQDREAGAGSGWVVAAGGDVPLRLFGSYDVFPRARGLLGEMDDEGGASRGFWGVELGFTVRIRP